MSETKFSKGPWRIQWPVPSAGECRKIRTAEGTAIMGDATYYPWTPEKTADWFLIAAAPEMYSDIENDIIWLEKLRQTFVLGSDEFRSCSLRIEYKRSLLEKARGEL